MRVLFTLFAILNFFCVFAAIATSTVSGWTVLNVIAGLLCVSAAITAD